MDALVIRPVAAADADAVVALWREIFPGYADARHPHRDPAASVARKLAVADGLFWLAERAGRPVGTAMAGWDGHRGWLYSVGVHPEARRAGVASRLVAEAERALAARGCPKINLQILDANEDGRAFWRRMGYAQDEVVCYGKRL